MNKFIVLGQGGEFKPPAKRKRDDSDSSDDEWLRFPAFKKKMQTKLNLRSKKMMKIEKKAPVLDLTQEMEVEEVDGSSVDSLTCDIDTTISHNLEVERSKLNGANVELQSQLDRE